MKNLLIACLLVAGSLPAAESLPQRVEAFLQPRRQTPGGQKADAAAVSAILARPDPGTFFLRYAFGLQRHARKLLSDEQGRALMAVIEKHKGAHGRWHDERNTLRCKFNEVMWRYAGADDAAAATLRAELDEWMRLRMTWTNLEHLAQYRFARDVWDVLDVAQRGKLLSGDWKAYATQDTGHTRGDATAKVITRALGQPDNKAAFDATAAEWSERRAPLHAVLSDAENRVRRIVFAMDVNTESLALESSEAAVAAYAKLYLAEADAIRLIVQAGYAAPHERCIAAAVVAWGEATKRFADGAPELIQILTAP